MCEQIIESYKILAKMMVRYVLRHLPKPRVISPLHSLRIRKEVDLVPLACEDCVESAILKKPKVISIEHLKQTLSLWKPPTL